MDAINEDVLMVGFDAAFDKDPSAICISRKNKNDLYVIKIKLGEQADILYRLLTEQDLDAAIMGGNPNV